MERHPVPKALVEANGMVSATNLIVRQSFGTGTGPVVALNAQLENFPGTQSYFFSGNVMPGYFTESNQTAGRKISYINRTEASVTWPVFVNSEFFPSYVTTQTATAAYEDVLADVGANVPVLDDHDNRVPVEL